MSYSNEIYNAALDVLTERRQKALRNAAYTTEQLFNQFPRLKEIDSELMSIGAAAGKFMLKKTDPEYLSRLSEKSLALQNEQKEILQSAGIDPSVMEPRFTCDKCNDNGFIELENRTVICDCLNKLMADLTAEQLNADLPLCECTFDNFSLSYYSDKPDENGRVPLNRMSKILNYCRDYADNFSLNSKNILMRGATGLGKTHLSLAIANEVIKKGMSVIYVTAPDILSRLEREHFSYQYHNEQDSFSSLLKCDLLIIDDLGTEFITQFSVSCMYNLLNSRLLASKPMIISTNLQLSELVTTYSQRFVSRLIGAADRLDFLGDDIRMMK